MDFKIQVWDSISKRMYAWYDDVASINSCGIISVADGNMLFLEDDNVHVRYFVGKCDVSGVEIYTGDILRELNGSNDDGSDKYNYYVAIWSKESCGFALEMLFVANDAIYANFCDYDTQIPQTIIGNIYKDKISELICNVL
jgi:hypothetical protein